MQIPPNTLVVLTLDPADYALSLTPDAGDSGATSAFSGSVAARTDGRVVLRYSSASGAVTEPVSDSTTAPPWGDVSFTIEDPELSVADGLFLLSVLLLTEHHQDAFLHHAHPWCFVDATTQRSFSVPHPPRIETAQALLGTVPVKTRVRLLIEACNIAVPVWTAWARHGDLGYFNGMSIESVRHDLAEATITAVTDWLSDGNPAPLSPLIGHFHGLHWPMLEDEWTCPQNVYYSLFASCNAADCARANGDLKLALVCIQQATAARATNGDDDFLGEPFRKAFFLAWWRACLRVLCT
ncbi:MAG: hypothetical protein ACI8RZ_002113 [Myxococcota bacterium]|jgi:hypothetical protein